MIRKTASLIFLAVLVFSAAIARAADDEPVSVLMAPTYVSFGYTVVGQLNSYRQTLAEFSLDDATRRQCYAMVDEALAKAKSLLGQLQHGPLPGSKTVTAMPAYLQGQQQKMNQLIGAAAAKKLQEAIASPRGQCRLFINVIALHVEQFKLDGQAAGQAKAAINHATATAAQLPNTAIMGDAWDKAFATHKQVLADLHDKLAAILTADQQDELVATFAAANRPATRPTTQP